MLVLFFLLSLGDLSMPMRVLMSMRVAVSMVVGAILAVNVLSLVVDLLLLEVLEHGFVNLVLLVDLIDHLDDAELELGREVSERRGPGRLDGGGGGGHGEAVGCMKR